jgi:NO-binding membrane sensor protein with MHYT domain
MNDTYNMLLVARSLAVGVVASYAAFELARRAGDRRGGAAALWFAGAGALMGGGIWALHFNAILAMRVPEAMAFSTVPTAFSLAIAVATSGMALWVARRFASTAFGHRVGRG